MNGKISFYHGAIFDWCLEEQPKKFIDFSIHQSRGNHKSHRNKVKLSEAEKKYLKKQGLIRIRNDFSEYVNTRLKIPNSKNKINYHKNHPIHSVKLATGLCCRQCMSEVFKIKEWTVLDDEREEKMVSTMIKWIQKEE